MREYVTAKIANWGVGKTKLGTGGWMRDMLKAKNIVKDDHVSATSPSNQTVWY